MSITDMEQQTVELAIEGTISCCVAPGQPGANASGGRR